MHNTPNTHRAAETANKEVDVIAESSRRKMALVPHAHLVEAVLKHMAAANSQPEAAIPPVVIPCRVDARSEVRALVVELNEAGNLEQRLQRALQQACILPQQRVQQPPVLFSKPACARAESMLADSGEASCTSSGKKATAVT